MKHSTFSVIYLKLNAQISCCMLACIILRAPLTESNGFPNYQIFDKADLTVIQSSAAFSIKFQDATATNLPKQHSKTFPIPIPMSTFYSSIEQDMKNIVLIRHGQSMGQIASRQGISRKDPSLHDCSLSQKGIQQAYDLRKDPILSAYNFDLVCTSPLMRAISTCAIGLGHIVTERSIITGEDLPTEFVVRAELCEFGSRIPENSGRPIEELSKILRRQLKVEAPDSLMCLDNFDVSSIPGTWPNTYNDSHRIQKFIAWLQQRDEKNIAIICHSLVIRKLLNNRIGSIPNCVPIECVLTCHGQLQLKTDCWIESAESSNERRAPSKRIQDKK